MKNNILFLSLTLLFILPAHAQTPDIDIGWIDPADDESDPKTQEALKELFSAAKKRLFHPSPTQTQPQTTSSERKIKRSPSKEEKEKQKRITELEEYLSTNQTKLDSYQASLDELYGKKRSCRRHEVGGLLVSSGAFGARYYEKITTLPAVIIGTMGALYIVWNEASAQRHGENADVLESNKLPIAERQETMETELNDLKK